MVNNMSAEAFKFIQNEGVNSYPSIAILACKLFVNTEGSKYGVNVKMTPGDNVSANPSGNGVSNISTIRDQAITYTQPFAIETDQKYLDFKRVFFENATYYVVKNDGLYKGSNLNDLSKLIDISKITDMLNIIRIFKTSQNTYVITTETGLYVYDSVTDISTKSTIPDSSVITGITYNSSRFIISAIGGIYFTNSIAFSSIVSGTTFSYNRRRYSSIITGTGVEGDPFITTDNGLDENDIYKGIASKSSTEIVVLCSLKVITILVSDLINGSLIMVTNTVEKITNGSSYSNSKEYLCTTVDTTEYPSNQIVLTGDITKTYSNGLYTVGFKNTGNIYIKSGISTIVFNNSNGIIPDNYKNIYIDNVDNKYFIKLIGESNKITSTYNKCDFYPIAFNYKTDYGKKDQNVKLLRYGVIEMCHALYDFSSIFYNSLLTANDGVPANFLMIRLENNGKNTWYLCGDDNRSASKFKSMANEFGIKTF